MNTDDILFWESEMRVGPWVLLEHYGLLGEVHAPCYQVRVERQGKIYKWDYTDREKALAFFRKLSAAEPPAAQPSAAKKRMSEKQESYLKYGYAHGGFPPPEKKWKSRLHPDE